MSFNENVRLDTSQVQAGSGGGGLGGGLKVGGGIGGLLMLILSLIFGGNVLGGSGDSYDPSSGGTTGSTSDNTAYNPGQVSSGGTAADISQCKTGADANANDTCLIVGTVNSVQAYWSATLPQYGRTYTNAPTVIYSGTQQSACGTASNQVGPFYCPLDKKVYIDASFFQELQTKFGANGGQLAKEYVVAHEYGHHIQDILGILNRAQQDPEGAQSGSVRTELMADCLAGVWVKHATETQSNGQAFLKPLTQQDITSALSAASAVGDDRIQQQMQGRVTPETWTHGSSAARQKWFTTGYQSGDLNQCNTFGVSTVE